MLLIGRFARVCGPGGMGLAAGVRGLGVIGVSVIGVSVIGADESVEIVRGGCAVMVVRPGVESGPEGLEEERGDTKPEGQRERPGDRGGAAHGSDQPGADCC